MQSIALVVHVALAVGLIGLVLIQHGKGADAGAAFGSGASATVFGARGSASFLTRLTTGVASAFFLTSLLLFYIAAHRDRGLDSVTDLPGSAVEQPAETAPDAPGDLPGGVAEEPADSDMPPAAPDAEGSSEAAPAGDAAPADGASGDQSGDLVAPAPDESAQ